MFSSSLKSLFLGLVSFSLLSCVSASDSSIIDALNQYNQKTNPVVAKPNFTLTQFNSCGEVSTVLTNFIKDNAEYFKMRGGGYPRPMMMDDGMMGRESMDTNAISVKSSPAGIAVGGTSGAPTPDAAVASSSRDFSTTNNQVAGVDEPDIIKTDGKYMYYVNERTKEIDIIKSPLLLGEGLGGGAQAQINLSQATLINSLSLPQSFRGTQLFIKNNTLVIIGQRYRENAGTPRFLDTSSRTTVLMFDISDVMKPKFLTLKDLPGNYTDARLIDTKLILVQQLNTNRRWGYDYWTKGQTLDTPLILPSSIDVSRSVTPMLINSKPLPISITKILPECDKVSYALPDSETLKHYNLDPNFTIISNIDISNPSNKVSSSITIGSTQTVHVSQNSVYLAQSLYTPSPRSCPFNARCFMPTFNAGQQTLLHKFSLLPAPAYKASNITQGSPLSQYSMSEDSNGNFRILTTQWDEKQSTHLFTFDAQLNPLGSLLNIEPGESFQSSRFIDDKLYLVTFQQIDPLFVIDLHNLQSPRIIGELKIPGYSTYLHPRGNQENGVQYLLGLGYDTATSPWGGGGIVNSGVKIDLYKVDFSKKDNNGNIQVFQTATKTLGGMDSQTEATYNPRMFVWDDIRKQLLLPLALATSIQTQQCTANYNTQGQEIPGTKQCYPNIINKSTFAGLKMFNIKPETGIQENYSVDYTPLLKKDTNFITQYNQEVQPWQFQSYMNRVGYAGDVVYTINQLFGHFALMNGSQETYISLDTKTPIK